MVDGDGHGRREALAVIPVIIGGKPVSARISGRERQRFGATAAQPHGAYPNVLSDSKRPAGKLHEESSVIVHVAVAPATKAERPKGAIQLVHGWRAREYEIRIHRLVSPTGVDVRAGSTREDRADSGSAEGIPHYHGDLGQRRSRVDLQRGFPVCLGLRRSSEARVCSVASGSSSRSR